MLWREDQLPRVKRGTKPPLRGKWESVDSGKHKDNGLKETHVLFSHDPPASGNGSSSQRR